MKVLLRRVQFLTLCYKTLTIKIRFCFYSSTNLSHNSSFFFFPVLLLKSVYCCLLIFGRKKQECHRQVWSPRWQVLLLCHTLRPPPVQGMPIYTVSKFQRHFIRNCMDLHDVDFLSLWEVEDFFGSWANYFVVLTNRKQRIVSVDISIW